MKLRITGASNFVNRMFEACGSYQWAREFLRNAVEAGASKVEFGIEWQAVEKFGTYRRTVVDNGAGMAADELYRFFSTLGEGGKKIGGVHDNFGVGAKIAALPWNPEGIVVISYKEGIGSMIWIVFEPDSGDYELVEFQTDEGPRCVIAPGEVDEIDWAQVRPDWVGEHGTVIVLLGSDEQPDTVLGNRLGGEKDIKGLSVYLNTRFWDLGNVEVTVAELRSDKKSQWPHSSSDKDDARRPNNRRMEGARYYISDVKAAAGRLIASGSVPVADGRVAAEWYLWEGDRPAIHMYARKSGYIGVRYNGEIFQATTNKLHYRWFGVIENKVQQNLTIILEPKHYDASNGRWGVHPDQSRNRLIFSGNGDKGTEIPLSDWALDFAENMPPEVMEAIRKARGDKSGSIEEEEYRKRLQDRFGSRWTVRKLVEAKSEVDVTPGRVTDEVVGAHESTDRKKNKNSRRRRKSSKVATRNSNVTGRLQAVPGGDAAAIVIDAPVDVPRYRFGAKDDFEKDWHLAVWAPNDPEGPVVVINGDSPILEEIIRYHQGQYPDVYAEEVADTVREVFGEIAACKIAHSQKLSRQVSAEELDQDYRSEQALTVALMGLLAEEAVVAQRLTKLGRKKASA